jgi:hypothetical protein
MEYVTKMPSSLHLFGEIWSHATKKKPRWGDAEMKKRGIERPSQGSLRPQSNFFRRFGSHVNSMEFLILFQVFCKEKRFEI